MTRYCMCTCAAGFAQRHLQQAVQALLAHEEHKTAPGRRITAA